MEADLQATAIARGKIECTDDTCGMKTWEIDFAQPVKSGIVTAKFGPVLVPVPSAKAQLIIIAIMQLIEYGEAALKVNYALAAELAKLAANPTTYCLGTRF